MGPKFVKLTFAGTTGPFCWDRHNALTAEAKRQGKTVPGLIQSWIADRLVALPAAGLGELSPEELAGERDD